MAAGAVFAAGSKATVRWYLPKPIDPANWWLAAGRCLPVNDGLKGTNHGQKLARSQQPEASIYL